MKSCRRVCWFVLLGVALHGTAFAAAPPLPDPERDSDRALLTREGLSVETLLDFIRNRTPNAEKLTEIHTLIRQLGDEVYDIRANASRQLQTIGVVAKQPLKEATHDPDVEVRERAALALEQLPLQKEAELTTAVIRELGRRNLPDTAAVLFEYLPNAEERGTIDLIAGAIRRVAIENGKAASIVLREVASASEVRRAVAGRVLCFAGKEQRGMVRKLLRDPSLLVRQRVAVALFDADDKESVPTLIDLLTETVAEDRAQVTERLLLLAGDKAPHFRGPEADPKDQLYQEDWRRWWRDAGPTADLTRIDRASRFLNYTLICSYRGINNGRVYELDGDGRERWSINRLRQPLSAEVVGHDRVLICERQSVSERTTSGEIIWQKAGAFSVDAHRMANGHTAIFNRTGTIEVVDRGGKVVQTFNCPNGLLSGEVDSAGNFHILSHIGYQRLDRTGAVQKTLAFPGGPIVQVGGFQVLSNGNILVPNFTQNKVIEVDNTGKVVWEIAATRPYTVQRLPNGNTLISTRFGVPPVIEVDRTGKQVSSRNGDGNVMYAHRR
jgi:hypothetical protein